MKARLEKIEPGFGSSFTVRYFDDINYCNTPRWHFHREYEIDYISNGRGKRHIGDHISYYEDGDLIFLGPNLPHFGFTEGLHERHIEIVVQMKEEFLGSDFFRRPELKGIKQLFDRGKVGVSFQGETKKQVGLLLNEMLQFDNFDRLLRLLRVLQCMATSTEYKMLNASGFGLEVNGQDHERIEKIYEYVERNFLSSVELEEASRLANMTVPAFCRYFKKLTNKTFTQFVNEFRIAHASSLLADDHLSIAAVSYESGFNNLSHFNKQFKAITGLSPREYRKNLKKIVKK